MEKIIPKFFGKKVNGAFKFDRSEENRYRAYMRNIKEGAEVFLAVGRKTKNTVRSEQQNKYYWGLVIDLLSVHTGYTPEEMHEALKFKFLRIQRDNLPDTVRSTAKLTKNEFCEYIDNVQKWAASEMGVYIPDAGEILI